MLMSFSRTSSSICAVLLFFGSSMLSHAQNTAFDSLEAFGKNRGQSELKRVVGVTGTFGQDQPHRWLILMKDARVPNLMHEYAMEKGRIVGERHFSLTPELNLPTTPLPLSELKIDSSEAFRITTKAAVKSRVGFESANYLLRIHHTRPSPVWTLTLHDQQHNTVGIIFITASSGKILSANWYRPGTPEYTRVNSHSVQEEISDLWTRGVNSVSRGIQKLDRKIEQKMNRSRTPKQPPPPPPGS